MFEKWRLIDLEYDDPLMNMTVEQAIPMAVGAHMSPATLRFWRNSNSVVIGRNQNAELEVNLEACEKYRTKIIRRFTGGGSVYQDLGNLNWAVSISKNEVNSHIFDFYQFCGSAIIEGINILGLDAQFVPPNMIEVNGRKISGMAAYLGWNAYFCHGTLLVNTNIMVLEEILNAPRVKSKQRYVSSIRTPVTTVREEKGEYIKMETVKKAVIKGFIEKHKINFHEYRLSHYEEGLAHKLYEEKSLSTLH